jgi:hypothetical protein
VKRVGPANCQALGHTNLQDFVGDLDELAPYHAG